MKRIITLLVAGVLFLSPLAAGAVPQLLNVQGVLRDGSGDPVPDSTYSVTFRIYNAAAAGSILWSEVQSVATTDGLFTVQLGSTTPVPDSLFFDTTRYLGITIPPDPEMTPRQRLTSAGYSSVSSQWTSSGTNVYRTAGSVGLGISAPSAPLHVGTAGSEGTPAFIAGTEIAAQATNPGNWAHMAIISSAFGRSRLNFGDALNDDQGIISYDNPLDAMWFSTANSEKMRITSAGNVGIGLTAPVVLLQAGHEGLEGAPGFLAGTVLAVQGTNFNDSTHMAIISGSNGRSRLNFGSAFDDHRGDVTYHNLSDAMSFSTASLERMRITSAGNVGIGITAPTAHVHAGSVGSEGIPTLIAGTQVVAQATNPDNWTHMAIIAGSAGRARLNFGDALNDDQGIVTYDNISDAMWFSTAASEKMRITSTGRVGVGTNAPEGALDVASTTGAFIVPRMTTVQRDALTAVNGMIIYNTTTNAFNFREAGAWVTK